MLPSWVPRVKERGECSEILPKSSLAFSPPWSLALWRGFCPEKPKWMGIRVGLKVALRQRSLRAPDCWGHWVSWCAPITPTQLYTWSPLHGPFPTAGSLRSCSLSYLEGWLSVQLQQTQWICSISSLMLWLTLQPAAGEPGCTGGSD